VIGKFTPRAPVTGGQRVGATSCTVKIDHATVSNAERFAISPAIDVYCAQVIEVADLRLLLRTNK
jgi:hypothetical protein